MFVKKKKSGLPSNIFNRAGRLWIDLKGGKTESLLSTFEKNRKCPALSVWIGESTPIMKV